MYAKRIGLWNEENAHQLHALHPITRGEAGGFGVFQPNFALQGPLQQRMSPFEINADGNLVAAWEL